MSPLPQLSAREYLRVSLDQSGYGRSVEQQHDENGRAAADREWTLGEPYRDNSVSASRYTRKTREDFDRLMADLESGRFGADVLILWESSRGSRREGEWVSLADVCRDAGVLVYVTKDDVLYDPRKGRDRKALLTEALDSAYESSKISDRIKRDNAANAAKGRPHGRVPYGYRRTYDPTTGRLTGQEPHPTEAPVVAELFGRTVAGHSLRSIARDYAARGIEKRSGGSFSSEHLRSLLMNATYAGQRVHDPARKDNNRRCRTANARVTPATWEAIVSEADYLAVQGILSNPARVTTRPGRGKHLLSMIARCAECGARLAATYRSNGRQYQCHQRGCVRINADDLDRLAEDVMLDYLSRDHTYNDVAARQHDESADLDGARDELARVRAELDDLADQVGRGALSPTMAARSEQLLLARLRRAEDRVRELSTPSALRGLIAPGEDVATTWQAAPMSTRRDVARLLLAPDMIGTLAVTRRPEGRRGGGAVMAASERVEWRKNKTVTELT